MRKRFMITALAIVSSFGLSQLAALTTEEKPLSNFFGILAFLLSAGFVVTFLLYSERLKVKVDDQTSSLITCSDAFNSAEENRRALEKNFGILKHLWNGGVYITTHSSEKPRYLFLAYNEGEDEAVISKQRNIYHSPERFFRLKAGKITIEMYDEALAVVAVATIEAESGQFISVNHVTHRGFWPDMIVGKELQAVTIPPGLVYAVQETPLEMTKRPLDPIDSAWVEEATNLN